MNFPGDLLLYAQVRNIAETWDRFASLCGLVGVLLFRTKTIIEGENRGLSGYLDCKVKVELEGEEVYIVSELKGTLSWIKGVIPFIERFRIPKELIEKSLLASGGDQKKFL